ncbi:MAG: hypothetical protein KAV87_26035 [Desulfobacteraceae bacterium]|nr:hypothetical protein [Desulfobacteraceae bacterium]
MPNREECVAALKLVLGQIPNQAGKVTRQFKTIKEVPAPKFPYILIEDDGSETITPKSNCFADISFNVSVWGYIKASQELSSKINEFDRLIKETVWKDFINKASGVTVGAGIILIEILPIIQRSGTEMNPFGFFERPYKIHYEAQYINGL